MEEDYYNKYWEKENSGKLLNLPPTWTNENLRWHYSFFRKYVGKSILDVGAGDGTFLNFVTKNNKHIEHSFASELSAEAVSIGKKKYPEIDFKNEPLERLGFESEVFDTVFAIEVVEHLLDIDQCLTEINRVMKNGGHLCITTTDFNLPKKIIIATFFWNKFFYPNNPHIRFFTKATLADICKKHGFELMKYKWNRSYFGLMPKGQMAVFKKNISSSQSQEHFEESHNSRNFPPPKDIKFCIYSDRIWKKFLSMSHMSDKIVDFGCGGGTVLYCLEKKGFRNLSGVDFCNSIPSGFLEYSKFYQSDILTANFEDNSFDSLVSTMVIEHVDEKKFKDEISKILKINGLALVTSVMKKKWAFYFYKNHKGERVIEPTHIKEYLNQEEFRDVFKDDFEIIDIDCPKLKYPVVDPIFRFLFKYFNVTALREMPTRNYFLTKLRKLRIPIPGYYSVEILLRKK